MLIVLYIVLSILGFWLLGNLFTYPLQDYFIFRPKRLRPDYHFSFSAEPEEVFIDTPHHGRINALWFRAAQSKGIILYFHGNAGNLARWGHLHHRFTRFGYDFFVYDYRGFGKSTGRRSERILYEDATAVFKHVQQYLPAEQIIVFGRSMGSAFACKIAADASVKKLILETPFSSMKELFYHYYPFLPRIFKFKYYFPNRKYLQQVQSPVYIFQGTDDWVVPYTCAARLKSYLKPDDEFITIPGGGHNDLLFFDIYNLKMEGILS